MKKALVIVGVILIVLQMVSVVGMMRMNVRLYPVGEDLYYLYSEEESAVGLRGYLFGFEAGFDRFVSGFGDLTYPKDQYRVMTSAQMTSAMIRESLGCGGEGGAGLFFYDVLVFLGYYFIGLSGVAALIVAKAAFRPKEVPAGPSHYAFSADEPSNNQPKWVCPKCGCTNLTSSRSCHSCGHYK